ncbi:MAG: TMEM175 family protein [Planctomycetota bacterium]
MLREHLFHKRAAADPMFRWRGGEVSRIEGISDGVFAVTLTLLVVTTSVPRTLWELWLLVRDLPVFIVSFVLLKQAWYYHYQFFRRYGLGDLGTVTLNSVFLFLVLFFAYPLKFLADFLWKLILGLPLEPLFSVPAEVAADHWLRDGLTQRSAMMVFYGAGLIGIFGVLALLLWRAWSKREELELDALERHLTRASLAHHLLQVSVAALSLILLALTRSPGLAGMTYFLLGPLHAAIGVWGGRKASRLHHALTTSAP